MKVPTSEVLRFLKELQNLQGGFTGDDVYSFARKQGLHPIAFARRVRLLLAKDQRFRGLEDLGKRRPNLTLDDIDVINARIHSTPDGVLQNLVDDINQRRQNRGIPPLPRSSLYRTIAGYRLDVAAKDTPLSYFQSRGIPVAPDYNLEASRLSLQTIYRLSGVTYWGGISLGNLIARLNGAMYWFQRTHPGVDLEHWFPELAPRIDCILGFLSTLHADERPDTQARLIFEQQVGFLVQTRDFTLDQIRIAQNRLLQSINASVLPELLATYRDRDSLVNTGMAMIDDPSSDEWAQLRHMMAISEKDMALLAQVRIRQQRLNAAARIYLYLSSLTRGFSPDIVQAHHLRAQTLLDLVRNVRTWENLSEQERVGLGKNRRLIPLTSLVGIQPEDMVHILLTERLVESIRRGKITMRQSWKYQDLGPLIRDMIVLPNEPQLTPEGLEQLINGTYPVDLRPLLELVNDGPEAIPVEKEEPDVPPTVDFTTVAEDVSETVRETNPDWFEEHKRVAIETSAGLFRMEYDEDKFANHFYKAVGMFGRNFRYSDSPDFRNLNHFVRRYMTGQALDMELTFLHRTLRDITGHEEDVLLTDSMGIPWRKTSPYATYHGRYHTIGVADVRGVGGCMVPVASLPCPSTDTEAMHAVRLVAKAQKILDGGVRIYTGNGHTTTRVCAGNLLLGFGVIGAGRFLGRPKPLSHYKEDRLRKNLSLLNKVGAFLRRYPDLGSVFSARTHVYVDGVNVRQLVDDVGNLLLMQVEKAEIPLHRILPRIEASNRMKRMVRIMERGSLRGFLPSIGVSLSSAELILAMSAVWIAKNRPSRQGMLEEFSIDEIAFIKPG
jgi:hypothetical protein